jgi:hypothetical protein
LSIAIGILEGDSTSHSSEAGSWPSDSSEASLLEPDETSAGVPAVSARGNLTATRFEEDLIDVSHVISCLYRFSIATRNPTPRDRFEQCALIDVSHFQAFDILHASNKFPEADRYLIERLGTANTRRRQLSKYYRRHHEKIAGPAELAVKPAKGDSESLEFPDETSTVITGTAQTVTTVSAFLPPSNSTDRYLNEVDTQSEGAFSQTSYAPFYDRQPSGFPALPERHILGGRPFLCPFCYCLVSAQNVLAWK